MLPASGLGSSVAPGLPFCAQEQLHLLIWETLQAAGEVLCGTV